MKAGVDFHLAYSPEREDPGRDDASVKTIPKVVGGYTPKCAGIAEALFATALGLFLSFLSLPHQEVDS